MEGTRWNYSPRISLGILSAFSKFRTPNSIPPQCLSSLLYHTTAHHNIPNNMASKNEKLCMAVIKNSTVTKIDWDGVAKDVGVATANAANHHWRRFKKTFDNSPSTTPVKANGGKK